MGSKAKQGGTPGGGMGPGQSRAMAGNVGLASVSEADAVKLQNAIQNINRATGGDRGSSFQDIAQNIAEQGSKFRRPADTERYINSMSQISDAINQGATVFTGPDGMQRVNFAGTGIKDPDTGATILSRQIPELTAVAPTLGQLGGDISRALTGYNTLEFPQGSNVPTMVRKGGLADVLSKIAIPGQIGLGIASDLFKKVFARQQEDNESSAADATGGASVMGLGDIRTARNLANTRSSDLVAFLRGDTSVDPNVKVGSFEPDTPFISVRNPNTGETEIMMDPEPGLARAVLGDETIKDLISLNQYPDRTLQGESTMNFPMAETRTGLSAEEKARQDLEAAGYSDDQINAIIDRTFFGHGGSVPPEKGPMSQGVGSLFQER
tara:strand:- start:193 stop:1335 length:1143 start_codon:yes stop_codon:yes gene_type:complete